MWVTKTISCALLVGAALLLTTAYGAAEDQGIADTIKMRQHKLKDIVGKDAKAISDQLKSGAPDKDTVAAKATEIATTLKDLPSWFPKGSGPEAGIKTLAKPDIWEQPDDFKKAYDTAQAAADKFAQVAQSGDLNAETTAFMSLGMGCQGCHKPFRVKPEGAP
jgi:cytochrome c556